VEAPDRGQLSVEIEIQSGAETMSVIPLELAGGRWVGAIPASSGDVRARLVDDGRSRRVEPSAPRVVIVGDEAWGLYPKQTSSSGSP
jgi:hypothetical protein